MKNEKIVGSILHAVATEELAKEIEKELEQADPSEEAIAKILEEDNENT